MIKTLLIVVALMTNQQVRVFHYQFDSSEECKERTKEAVEIINKLEGSDTVIAFCTTTLQLAPVEKLRQYNRSIREKV